MRVEMKKEESVPTVKEASETVRTVMKFSASMNNVDSLSE